MILEQLTAEANIMAAERNGEILDAAFKRASIECPHCNFPQNCGRFRRLLYHYTRLKIKLHRMRQAYNSSILDRWGECYRSLWRYKNEREYGRSEQNALYREVMSERRDLQEIWPCDECRLRYNPTGRRNDCYPEFNQPQTKGFLEL